MSVAAGTRLGVYEIVGRLGAGGMGEVYRARDTRLAREVALKVLPSELATDPERLVRFEREAKALAALNHPNIAQIHGFESAAAVPAIVMELVEGEDLQARIARGRMPLDEALPVARQIAEALEAAHGSGIVHRDLKPANIKIRTDGTVKVLDFGLAKLTETDADRVSGAVTDSPTIASPAMTQLGVILGTAAYMAPEQAKGRIVDKRADIWAFGCVLYEMLTGHRLFQGEDVSETLAAVLSSDPDWQALPADTPEPIRRLLRRCLVRDPRQRISDIGVARMEIDEALTGTPGRERRAPPPTIVWALVAGLMAGVTLATAAFLSWRETSAEPESRVLQITSGDDISAPRLASHGRAVVFVRKGRLVVRSLESGAEQELSGTDGASNPTWSPDGTNLAYFGTGEAGAELRVVPATGGASRVVVRGSLKDPGRAAPFPVFGTAWCEAGIFYIGRARDLRVVRNDGQDAVFLAASESTQFFGGLAYPYCLSDGRLLAVQRRQDTGVSSIVVVAQDAINVLLELPVSNTVAVRSPVLIGSTHVVFERTEPNAGLWVVPVTASLSNRTGPEHLVFPDVARPSVAGTLLTALSGVKVGDREMVWVDRSGTRLGTFGRPQREFLTPALSPDGSQLATGGRIQDSDEIRIHRQDTVARWTSPDAFGWPAWSPDGRHLAYVPRNRTQLVVRTARGSEPRRIAEVKLVTEPTWAPDGKTLVYSTLPDRTWLVPVDGATPPRPLLEHAGEVAISPDGRLIAYASLVTGRSEVYVTTFPEPGEAAPVSTAGGRFPRWRPKSNELFFPCGPTVGEDPQSSRDLCMAVIESSGVRRGPPVRLFDATSRDLRLASLGQRGYDVAPDGRLLVQTTGVSGTPSITLIENVEAWLRRTLR